MGYTYDNALSHLFLLTISIIEVKIMLASTKETRGNTITTGSGQDFEKKKENKPNCC